MTVRIEILIVTTALQLPDTADWYKSIHCHSVVLVDLTAWIESLSGMS